MVIEMLNSSINLAVTRELKEQLQAIAKQEERSLNNLITVILKDYLAAREEQE